MHMLLTSVWAFSQEVISGTIHSDEGEGLYTAEVSLFTLNTTEPGKPKAFHSGTVTDLNGRFKLTYDGNFPVLLEITYTGFRKKQLTLTSASVDLDIELEREYYSLPGELVITATRVEDDAPVVHTNLDAEEIAGMNTGKDVPYVVSQTPSVVSSSDAGAGVGYTAMRIRGIDQANINVTINGIALNDPESQGVYWVDVPDLSTSLSSIQIQRGVGSSTNGPAAFGASMNMVTEAHSYDTSFNVGMAWGSFNTLRANAEFSSGLRGKHWTFYGRLSTIKSDGYVDRASTKLMSYYISTGYENKKTAIQLLFFGGREETYQAWYGVDSLTLATDRTLNFAGAKYAADGSVTGYHNNEIDHYDQDHIQIHLNQQLNNKWKIQAALHGTYGRGYFEQYMQGAPLDIYGSPGEFGDTSVKTADVVIRPWLDNTYLGSTFNTAYRSGGLNAMEIDIGGAANTYFGRHFGRLMWTSLTDGADMNKEFYRNLGLKNDMNVYFKARKYIGHFIPFLDVQYRVVRYGVHGTDDYFGQLDLDRSYHFFNPKAGLTYRKDDVNQFYYTIGLSNREPSRSDLLYSDNFSAGHEVLLDHELGYRHQGRKNQYNANLYYMNYRDQLVPTGALNDVGVAIRQNIGRSFRTGIELAADIYIYRSTVKNGSNSSLKWKPNLTCSMNRNLAFNKLGADGSYKVTETVIALSPQLIANNALVLDPNFKFMQMKFSLFSTIISKQYLDNNELDSRSLKAYQVHDLRLDLPLTITRQYPANWWITVYNILDAKYESFGYVYGTTPYYFPQAGRHFMTGLSLNF